MNVSDAIDTRYTCRAFLPDKVPEATVRSILTLAARTPSGGNLQPWRVWAVAGAALDRLSGLIKAQIKTGAFADGDVEYAIYPPDMKEPYAARHFRSGEALYEALGVGRDDYPARIRNYEANYDMFGAPIGLIFAIDRGMQQGQWTELGMYMQSVMLLAREHGLDTCPLESWSFWHNTVRKFCNIPGELIVFCAMGLGRADPIAPVNRFRTEREPLEAYAGFIGFDGAPAIADPVRAEPVLAG